MDSPQLQHLLSKHSIMVSFRISKSINPENIEKLKEKLKPITKDENDLNDKLNDALEKETSQIILNGAIPGLLINGVQPKIEKQKINSTTPLAYCEDKLKIAELYMTALNFNTDVLKKKYTTNDICFILYHILNFLDIEEKDFKKFMQDLNSGDTLGEIKDE